MLLNWREDKGQFLTRTILTINAIQWFMYESCRRRLWKDLGTFISSYLTRLYATTAPPTLSTSKMTSLRIQVKRLAVYSTPLLLKTPTWQNPRNCYIITQPFTVNFKDSES